MISSQSFHLQCIFSSFLAMSSWIWGGGAPQSPSGPTRKIHIMRLCGINIIQMLRKASLTHHTAVLDQMHNLPPSLWKKNKVVKNNFNWFEFELVNNICIIQYLCITTAGPWVSAASVNKDEDGCLLPEVPARKIDCRHFPRERESALRKSCKLPITSAAVDQEVRVRVWFVRLSTLTAGPVKLDRILSCEGGAYWHIWICSLSLVPYEWAAPAAAPVSRRRCCWRFALRQTRFFIHCCQINCRHTPFLILSSFKETADGGIGRCSAHPEHSSPNLPLKAERCKSTHVT